MTDTANQMPSQLSLFESQEILSKLFSANRDGSKCSICAQVIVGKAFVLCTAPIAKQKMSGRDTRHFGRLPQPHVAHTACETCVGDDDHVGLKSRCKACLTALQPSFEGMDANDYYFLAGMACTPPVENRLASDLVSNNHAAQQQFQVLVDKEDEERRRVGAERRAQALQAQREKNQLKDAAEQAEADALQQAQQMHDASAAAATVEEARKAKEQAIAEAKAAYEATIAESTRVHKQKLEEERARAEEEARRTIEEARERAEASAQRAKEDALKEVEQLCQAAEEEAKNLKERARQQAEREEAARLKAAQQQQLNDDGSPPRASSSTSGKRPAKAMSAEAAARKAQKLQDNAKEKRAKLANHDVLMSKNAALEVRVQRLSDKLDGVTDVATRHVTMHIETTRAACAAAVKLLPEGQRQAFHDILQQARMRIRNDCEDIPDDMENGQVLFTSDPHGKISIEEHINLVHDTVDDDHAGTAQI